MVWNLVLSATRNKHRPITHFSSDNLRFAHSSWAVYECNTKRCILVYIKAKQPNQGYETINQLPSDLRGKLWHRKPHIMLYHSAALQWARPWSHVRGHDGCQSVPEMLSPAHEKQPGLSHQRKCHVSDNHFFNLLPSVRLGRSWVYIESAKPTYVFCGHVLTTKYSLES